MAIPCTRKDMFDVANRRLVVHYDKKELVRLTLIASENPYLLCERLFPSHHVLNSVEKICECYMCTFPVARPIHTITRYYTIVA